MSTIISHVISQHAEEAAFLWLLRDAAVGEPHYSLADLAALDERIEAHCDGLRIAGEAGWELCVEQLAFAEDGEFFAAGVQAFGTDDMSRIRTVLDAACAAPEAVRGLVSALGWLPYETISQRVTQLLRAESPVLRRIGIAAMAVHRQDPGESLAPAIDTDDQSLQFRSLRAAGELGRTDLLPVLRQHLRDVGPETSAWAAWSAALLGDAGAAEALWTQSGQLDGPLRDRTLDMALRCTEPATAMAWQEQMSTEPESRRQAVIAAGIIGDPVRIPWIIEQFTDESVARAAGEAFTMITGVDLAYDDLDTDAPSSLEAGASDEPDDADVALDPDEDLPWPDAELIAAWWKDHAAEFTPGMRYLIGKPMTEVWLESVIRDGRQRQRRAAALELAIRRPGTPLFEVRATGKWQQTLLGVT